ncbi:MAG: hypothetical protein V4529_16715 [Gemmatimonadota bacterium]
MNRLSRRANWKGLRREREKSHVVPCRVCGAPLRFDVPDPMRLGRSMEQCTNGQCVGATPHVIKPQSMSA